MNNLIDVHASNGVLVTTSRNIAAVFGKEHYNVLKDIKALLVRCSPEFNAVNFYGVTYKDVKGEERPEYLLTKDGTTMLVMGYNGEKAMAFKEAYIKRFNEMEALLQQPHLTNPVIGKMEAAKVLLEPVGIKGNQLVLALDQVYKHNTGESLLAQTGIQLTNPKNSHLCTPTELGREMGLSAQDFNKLLEAHHLQARIGGKWEPTDAGRDAGAAVLDTGKRHSDGTPVTQLKWPGTILNYIKAE